MTAPTPPEQRLIADYVATWTCPTCGLVYSDQEDMKAHAYGHAAPARYSDWGDDWVGRCDNLLDQNEKLEHDLGIRWGERNEALDALRALLADYEKVVQIAVSAGFRAPRMASPAAQRVAALLARIDGPGSSVPGGGYTVFGVPSRHGRENFPPASGTDTPLVATGEQERK